MLAAGQYIFIAGHQRAHELAPANRLRTMPLHAAKHGWCQEGGSRAHAHPTTCTGEYHNYISCLIGLPKPFKDTHTAIHHWMLMQRDVLQSLEANLQARLAVWSAPLPWLPLSKNCMNSTAR